jgi:RNA polymerase sigma factor (sigma-70 family)
MLGSERQIESATDSTTPDAAGDFERFYRAEVPWLIRFFRRQVGDGSEAQDLAQEAMLRFVNHGSPAALTSPQAYLRRIAVNLVRDRAKSGSNQLARLTAPLLDGLDREVGIDQHRIVESREELAQWEAILSKLKPRTLEIFLLSRVDGLTYSQIASHLGTTIFNVKWHMLSAIRHVARHRGDR